MRAYYIRRRGEPLILSSLLYAEADGLCDDESMVWISSGLIRREEEEDASKVIYREADDVVSLWIQNRRYIPRLVISAVVFLFSYFFFTLVIRDPIPMIDEILIGLLLATLAWIWLSRLDEKSSMAEAKREVLYNAIENASFEYSDDIKVCEEYYESLYGYKALELSRMIASSTLPELAVKDEPELERAMKAYMQKENKAMDRILKRLEDDEEEKTARFLLHQAAVSGLDLQNLAFYSALTSKN